MHKTIANLLEIHPPGSAARAPVSAEIGTEILAGIVASFVTLAHCLSFSALIFSGALRDGFSLGLWGFMAASALTSLAAALATTLPPYLAGPRNPVVAVMGVLAAVVTADVLMGGGSDASALRHVLLAFSLAGLLTGAALWLLGRFRLGQIVRFVPYPVIGGFLAASGWLLISGGLTLSIGKPIAWATLSTLTIDDGARLFLAVLFAVLVIGLRRMGVGSIALPLLFLSATVVLDLALWLAGLRAGWFQDSTPAAQFWSPLGALQLGPGSAEPIQLQVLLRATVEIMTIAAVSVFAMPLDLSSLEVQRRTNADIDAEFRSTGAVNIVMALFGGLPVGLAPNTSRLADELGATSRLSGLAAGVFVGLVLLAGLDVAALVPMPLLAGLVLFLGLNVLGDVFASPSTVPSMGQSMGGSGGRSLGRSWGETLLTLAIMLAIVQFGYLAGIVFGLVAACLLFAVRYSRIDAIRRHLTRAEFASAIERAPAEQIALREAGGRIHILWLNGFIFFGSANRIFDQIRSRLDVENGKLNTVKPPSRWMVLELSGVSGIDSSALVSFTKLRSWALSNNLILVLAGVPVVLVRELGLADANALRVFPSRTDALAWCEDALLAEFRDARVTIEGQLVPNGGAGVTAWLGWELGVDAAERLTERYLEKLLLAPGDCLCRQGEPADKLHFVASGSLSIDVCDDQGRATTLRRMNGHTVVGEMGFFRQSLRTASVVAASDTIVFALDRRSYDALADEDPALARALLEFVVRIQADRVEFANREIAALI